MTMKNVFFRTLKIIADKIDEIIEESNRNTKTIDEKKSQSKENFNIDNPRYPMCKDQLAQIDCGNKNCIFHHQDDGSCHNISPAITLNENKTFICWSQFARDNRKK